IRQRKDCLKKFAGQLSSVSCQRGVNSRRSERRRRIRSTTVLPDEYWAQRCYQANTKHNGATRRILGTTVLPGEYEAQRCYQANTGHNGATRRIPVSYTHLRAHETPEHLVCRLLLEK